jgi:phage terminase small subunit
MKLTTKQKRFVEEYLIDLNAAQAAVRAGYSQKTAGEQGYQLLQKTSISKAIDAAIKRRSQRTELTQDMVLQELRSIAFTRITDVVEWGETMVKQVDAGGESINVPFTGIKLKNHKDISEYALPAVAKIREDKSGGLLIEMHNKVQALTLLGKHLGMFIERTEVTGRDGGAIELSDTERAARLSALVAAARERKAESDAGADS